MATKMIVLRTYDGLEGFRTKGDKIEVVSKNRALALYSSKYAEFEGKAVEEIAAVGPTDAERVDSATTHAQLDELVLEFGLDGIPTKAEGATLTERKTAIKAAL